MGLQLNEIDRFNLMKQLIDKPDVFQTYDPTVKVPREELEDLIDAAIQAPASWDEQHWKFLIFDDASVKEQYLYPISGSQSYIRDASAVVAVLGDRRVYGHMKETESGQNVSPIFQPQNVSEIDSPPLAAIQFMIGATTKGYDTYPTLQFDAEELANTFNIPDQFIPVMLVAIGKRKETSGSTYANGRISTIL